MTEEKLSKTARKKFAEAQQALGASLLALNAAQLSHVPLSPKLEIAIADHHRIKSREAKRRQAQLIGKLMRSEDTATIEKAVADLTRSSATAKFEHHQHEAWRDRLLDEPDALTEYLNEHPDTDAQQLRRLIRQTRSAPKDDAKKQLRALFRFIRDNSLAPD